MKQSSCQFGRFRFAAGPTDVPRITWTGSQSTRRTVCYRPTIGHSQAARPGFKQGANLEWHRQQQIASCPQCGHNRELRTNEQLPIRIDFVRGLATWGDRPPLRIPPSELVLLAALVRSFPQGLRKLEAYNELYAGHPQGGADPKTLSVFLCHLRRYIREAGWPLKIENGRGFGWTLIVRELETA